MRGHRILLVVGLVTASLAGCTVQAGARFGTGATPEPTTARATPRRSSQAHAVGGPQTSDPHASTDGVSTDLKLVTERDLSRYRDIVTGQYDVIVLDPKRVNAENNVITRAMRDDEARLTAHAAKYDVAAVLQTRQPCVTEIEAILNEQATEAIRQTEDDVQFTHRRDAGQKGLAAFQRSMSLAPEVSQADLQFSYRLFVTKVDDRGQPIAGLPRPRTEWERRIESVTDKGVCHARYLLVINDWWKRHRADLDAKREATETTKAGEARKAVLSRRFAPVTLECSENWKSTSPKMRRTFGPLRRRTRRVPRRVSIFRGRGNEAFVPKCALHVRGGVRPGHRSELRYQEAGGIDCHQRGGHTRDLRVQVQLPRTRSSGPRSTAPQCRGRAGRRQIVLRWSGYEAVPGRLSAHRSVK